MKHRRNLSLNVLNANHHAADDFCKKLGEPIHAKNYRDEYGDFYTRFWWNGNGVEVVLANLILEEERRGTDLLKEIIDHLKLDSRVPRICIEQVGPKDSNNICKRWDFTKTNPNLPIHFVP